MNFIALEEDNYGLPGDLEGEDNGDCLRLDMADQRTGYVLEYIALKNSGGWL